MKKMKVAPKIVLILFILGIIVQAGFSVFAETTNVSPTPTPTATASALTPTPTQTTATIPTTSNDLNNIQIADDVLAKIKESDPDHYDKNLNNYKNLLVNLNVSSTFKQGIEKLILDGYQLRDILIGYEFVYHQFGTMEDLQSFLVKKQSGAAWEQIFTDYNRNKAEFVPRAFDSAYLEKLMNTQGISSDDIIIADRVSFVTGKSIADIINDRLKSVSWKVTNEGLGILYSSDTLPRVQITIDQMKKYTASGELTEDQVARAFVLANKVGKSADYIVDKGKSGFSDEAIFAACYVEKYN